MEGWVRGNQVLQATIWSSRCHPHLLTLSPHHMGRIGSSWPGTFQLNPAAGKTSTPVEARECRLPLTHSYGNTFPS
ncbi:hypothetical protein Pmani_008063 [Petrolisthes manimaculis]|uniref:Uncharacterized protein n=1 Tax=Petrolisthes manimaculis TaxID=1843537 RepID=A0AAE1Q7P2_9EUCA|nr:hypothetical protein Pmani_008063 [Petrolisthes manimaculis]